MNTIILNDVDATLFLEFRKNQDAFKILSDNKIFDTQSGSVVLHFNLEGRLVKVDRNQVLFFAKLSP